jgi:hypothetical protein
VSRSGRRRPGKPSLVDPAARTRRGEECGHHPRQHDSVRSITTVDDGEAHLCPRKAARFRIETVKMLSTSLANLATNCRCPKRLKRQSWPTTAWIRELSSSCRGSSRMRIHIQFLFCGYFRVGGLHNGPLQIGQRRSHCRRHTGEAGRLLSDVDAMLVRGPMPEPLLGMSALLRMNVEMSDGMMSLSCSADTARPTVAPSSVPKPREPTRRH